MKRPPELRDTRPQRDSPAYGGEAPAAAGDSGAAGMMAGAAGDSGAAGAPRGSRGSALHRGLGAALALRRRARRGQRGALPRCAARFFTALQGQFPSEANPAFQS